MNTSDTIHLDLPAHLKYLNVLDSCVREMLMRDELSDEIIGSIQLAVHELCTNIVRHSYAGGDGRIQISITIAANHILVQTQDTGRQVLSLSPIHQPHADHPREGGYGLSLIHELMDEVTYQSRHGNAWSTSAHGVWEPHTAWHASSGGNIWRLIKYMPAVSSAPSAASSPEEV